MPKNHLQHLTKAQREELFDALNYMNMAEIKRFCIKHSIVQNGKKGLYLIV